MEGFKGQYDCSEPKNRCVVYQMVKIICRKLIMLTTYQTKTSLRSNSGIMANSVYQGEFTKAQDGKSISYD